MARIEEKLRKIAYTFGASLRYLQFRNGNLISAHGGCLGDYNRYVKLLGEIKKHRGGDEVSNLGFSRLNGARMSMIIDTSPPIYRKRYGIAHAGFSSFELYYGLRLFLLTAEEVTDLGKNIGNIAKVLRLTTFCC